MPDSRLSPSSRSRLTDSGFAWSYEEGEGEGWGDWAKPKDLAPLALSEKKKPDRSSPPSLFLDVQEVAMRSQSNRPSHFTRKHSSGVVKVLPIIYDNSRTMAEQSESPATTATLGIRAVCPICLDHFVSGDGIVVVRCGHVFHDRCLDEWTKRMRNCATCRTPVFSTDVFKVRFATDYDQAQRVAKRAYGEQIARMEESFEEKLFDLRDERDTALTRMELFVAEAGRYKGLMDAAKAEHTRLRTQVGRVNSENEKLRAESGLLKQQLQQRVPARQRPPVVRAVAAPRSAAVPARPMPPRPKFFVPIRRQSSFPAVAPPLRRKANPTSRRAIAPVRIIHPSEPEQVQGHEEDAPGPSGMAHRPTPVPNRENRLVSKRPRIGEAPRI